MFKLSDIIEDEITWSLLTKTSKGKRVLTLALITAMLLLVECSIIVGIFNSKEVAIQIIYGLNLLMLLFVFTLVLLDYTQCY